MFAQVSVPEHTGLVCNSKIQTFMNLFKDLIVERFYNLKLFISYSLLLVSIFMKFYISTYIGTVLEKLAMQTIYYYA